MTSSCSKAGLDLLRQCIHQCRPRHLGCIQDLRAWVVRLVEEPLSLPGAEKQCAVSVPNTSLGRRKDAADQGADFPAFV